MNHYYKIVLACFTVFFFSAPAMASGSANCGGPNATPAETRNCLARMSDPAAVRQRHEQEKRDRCEQNAKNRGLQGGAKASYISSCMNENRAADAQKSVSQRRPVLTPRTQPRNAASPARHSKRASANSCVAKANKAHLKGDKRRQFLKTCKPR